MATRPSTAIRTFDCRACGASGECQVCLGGRLDLRDCPACSRSARCRRCGGSGIREPHRPPFRAALPEPFR